jgi:hypothetical protein
MRPKIMAIAVTLFFVGCGAGGEDETNSWGPVMEGKADLVGKHWHGPHANPSFAYELTAERTIYGLSSKDIAGKKTAIDEAVDLLVARTKKMPHLKLQVGTNGVDRLNFPPVDLDMDGTPDEAAKKIELSSASDWWMLASTSKAHVIAARWSVVVYTEGDQIKIVIGVPETFTRLYFRGEPNMPALVYMAQWIHADLRYLAHSALVHHGYSTRVDLGIPGTELDEQRIAQIEAMVGPVTAESIAPSLTLSQVKVKDVVAALEAAYSAPRVPDLNQDGVVDQGDEAVLPTMFGEYMQGMVTFEQMGQMMGQGFSMWKGGYTFQQWANPRTIDLSSPWLGQSFIVELCQPFYANTALSTGLYHIPSMPCAVSVWEEKGKVRVNLLDPGFIFAYFFADAAPQMPPAMQQLFAVFPTFVYNEMVGILNAAMTDLGQTEALSYRSFPQAS